MNGNLDFEIVDLDSRKALERIDERKKSFPNYKRIRISNCNLAKFPNENFVKLLYLDISYNSLEEIPVIKCRLLETLDISSNKINVCSMAKFRECPNIKCLMLSKNIIKYLDYGEEQALPRELEKLVLHQNMLTTINPHKPINSKLKYLDVSSNPITDINYITNYDGLQVLLLNNTKIECIKPLEKLNMLKRLGLIGTKVKELSKETVLQFYHLTEIYLNETRIETPPLSCVIKGIKSIREYYKIDQEELIKRKKENDQIKEKEMFFKSPHAEHNKENDNDAPRNENDNSNLPNAKIFEEVDKEKKFYETIVHSSSMESFISCEIKLNIEQNNFFARLNKILNPTSVYSQWRKVENANPALMTLYQSLRAKLSPIELKIKLVEIKFIIESFCQEFSDAHLQKLKLLSLTARKSFEYMIGDCFLQSIKKYTELLQMLKLCGFKASCKKGDSLCLTIEKKERNYRKMKEMLDHFKLLCDSTDGLKLVGI